MYTGRWDPSNRMAVINAIKLNQKDMGTLINDKAQLNDNSERNSNNVLHLTELSNTHMHCIEIIIDWMNLDLDCSTMSSENIFYNFC